MTIITKILKDVKLKKSYSPFSIIFNPVISTAQAKLLKASLRSFWVCPTPLFALPFFDPKRRAKHA